MNDTYNGWTNRETWLVALWINNEQGWQESVHHDVRDLLTAREGLDMVTPEGYAAGQVIRENVENVLDMLTEDNSDHPLTSGLFGDLLGTALARVDWDELGAAFLADLDDQE